MTRRRPPPIVVDSLLAIVLAIASLGIADGGTTVSDSPVPQFSWSVSRPPPQAGPGDVWDARIVVFRNGVPGPPPGGFPPVLELRGGTMFTTTTARPTGTPGFYRARVVLRGSPPYEQVVFLEGLPAGADDPPGLPAGLVLLILLATLPVALRRRAPLPVLGITLTAATAAAVAYDSFVVPGPLVALYSVGAHVARPTSLLAAGGGAAALLVQVLAVAGLGIWEVLGLYALFAAAWLLGDNARSRRERTARLVAERQANIGRAAAEEQARMARELHDIIGHSVSVMTIQAAAANDAFESRPAEVREALRAIESTGRETLAELRRLLAGVRPDEAGAFAPAPGLDNLDALAERVRAAGLAVELAANGRPAALPPSIDLSAYRIVQEALTNTLKHAGATTARVTVRQAEGVLEIDVVDDGRGAPADAAEGHGIIGMRERAALFGGELRVGPAPGGGFAVHARIPIEEAA